MASIPLMYAQEDCELGGKESIEDDFAYRNNVMNADKEIRLAFVRKVYGLLSVQLLATVAIASVFMLVKPIQSFIHENQWMVVIAFLLSIVTLFALIAKRRDSPANLYLLAAFTTVQAYSIGVVVSFCDTLVVLQALAITFASHYFTLYPFLSLTNFTYYYNKSLLQERERLRYRSYTAHLHRKYLITFLKRGHKTIVQAYSIGVVVSFCDTLVVLQALAITFAVVFGLTLYTLNTKRDFSFIGYGLVAGLCVLIVGGILQIFIQSSVFEVALSFAGAVIFSLFLVFDTQQMMTQLSPEEYILATINLYMDILNLFLYILRILNEMNRN